MTNGTDKKLNEEIAKTETYIAELEAAIEWQRVYLAKLMFKGCRHTRPEQANDNNQ